MQGNRFYLAFDRHQHGATERLPAPTFEVACTRFQDETQSRRWAGDRVNQFIDLVLDGLHALEWAD